MGLFQTLSVRGMAAHISAAKHLVYYCAPGIGASVANALVEAAGRLKPGRVFAVLDISDQSCRLGFGQIDAVCAIRAAGVDLRDESGLRLGLLIVDGYGWSFALPPALVELPLGEDTQACNAIALTEAQVIVLRGELPQPPPDAKQLTAADDGQGPKLKLSLGARKADMAKVAEVKKGLDKIPPRDFALEQRVRVYSSFIRFVELEFRGARMTGKTVTLPKELSLLDSNDKKLKDRIRASLRILESASSACFKQIEDAVREIRQAYCLSIGSNDSIVLVSNEAELRNRVIALQEKIEKGRQEMANELRDSLTAAFSELVNQLADVALKNPPLLMLGRFPKTSEGARGFVQERLDKVFPDAKDLADSVSLRLDFKDVTYTHLNDGSFQQRVFNVVPKVSLPDGLHQEYEAAKQRERAPH